MEITKEITDLICELEYIIGSQCYNPNSHNGKTMENGCNFRYPVSYKDKDGNEDKTRRKITDIDKSKVNTIKYEFGSNNLNIGVAIKKVLETLESEYGLDFNELTKSKKKKDETKTSTRTKEKPIHGVIVKRKIYRAHF